MQILKYSSYKAEVRTLVNNIEDFINKRRKRLFKCIQGMRGEVEVQYDQGLLHEVVKE